MKNMQIIIIFLALIILSILGYAGNEQLFNGKTIKMIVTNAPGGGYDTYARMIRPFLEKNLPGCKVLVDNIGGAGGEIGRNLAYIAKPDGLTICLTSGSDIVLNTIMNADKVKYDIYQWVYLARVSIESSVLTVPTNSEYSTFKDIVNSRKKLLFSPDGVGDVDYFTLALISHIFGFDIMPITGYTGSKEASMSAIRGEVDLYQSGIGTVLPLIQNGDVKPVLFYGTERDPRIPWVPTILELINDEQYKLDEIDKKIIKAVIEVDEVRRVLLAPPGLDEKTTHILREAIYKALNDPELIEISKKINRPIVYFGGEEIAQLIKDVMEIKDLVQPILENALKLAE